MIRLDRESLATLAMAAVAVVNKGLLNNFGGLTGGGGGARFAIVHTPALRKRRRHEAKEGGTEGGNQ